MDKMMTPSEIALAQRIIGLRRYSVKATKNRWECRFRRDIPARQGLEDKGYIEPSREPGGWFWKMTPAGIQQLKLQIGEFTFR